MSDLRLGLLRSQMTYMRVATWAGRASGTYRGRGLIYQLSLSLFIPQASGFIIAALAADTLTRRFGRTKVRRMLLRKDPSVVYKLTALRIR